VRSGLNLLVVPHRLLGRTSRLFERTCAAIPTRASSVVTRPSVTPSTGATRTQFRDRLRKRDRTGQASTMPIPPTSRLVQDQIHHGGPCAPNANADTDCLVRWLTTCSSRRKSNRTHEPATRRTLGPRCAEASFRRSRRQALHRLDSVDGERPINLPTPFAAIRDIRVSSDVRRTIVGRASTFGACPPGMYISGAAGCRVHDDGTSTTMPDHRPHYLR